MDFASHLFQIFVADGLGKVISMVANLDPKDSYYTPHWESGGLNLLFNVPSRWTVQLIRLVFSFLLPRSMLLPGISLKVLTLFVNLTCFWPLYKLFRWWDLDYSKILHIYKWDNEINTEGSIPVNYSLTSIEFTCLIYVGL